MLMNIHSINPTMMVRQPTTRTACRESELPMRNNTKIMPRRARSEIGGDHTATAGT